MDSAHLGRQIEDECVTGDGMLDWRHDGLLTECDWEGARVLPYDTLVTLPRGCIFII